MQVWANDISEVHFTSTIYNWNIVNPNVGIRSSKFQLPKTMEHTIIINKTKK